jgi:cyclic pyranopterin phosphate synthase
MPAKLSHLDSRGRANMVNVGNKKVSRRVAIACSKIFMKPKTLELILRDGLPKGDVLTVARLAGIMAAKKTSELIPLCHPLALSVINVELTPKKSTSSIEIEATCEVDGKTGVEMEALVYDMCKAVDRSMVVSEVQLKYKAGGKSGEYKFSDSIVLEGK